ncbi:MAG: response regulator [Tannerellaceae bacterium]|nr:response regulator [Tannerellaceae bacterium]
MKYAKSQILITVQEDANEESLILKIYNDGYLIPAEYADKIFEPFYQLKDVHEGSIPSGTGLGLSLARSLAALHNGSLILDTSNEVLNTFVFTIPMRHHKTIDLHTEEIADQEVETEPQTHAALDSENRSGKQTILIVEDDAGMQRFVANILKNKYNIKVGNNRQEALDILEKEHIDLIISDILMPVMDGLQLCKQVKSILNYSHIPIVLLTAKTGIGANIEGLDAGADAYIEKPFSTEYLQAQLANLFTNREKMKLSFANSPFSTAGTMASSKADEEFLQKITDIIHKHLSDENFSVEVLAEELNMSRSSLHRKIKGISELTPNDFILLVRLKKAAELLTNKTYRVTEVCYVVGFSSSSYFSKCFKKYFGLSPRDFIKKEEEKNRKE